MPSSTRGYSAGKFAFELEGTIVGYVDSVEGGEAVGTVIEEPVDANGVIPKRIGGVHFEPITVTFSGGMGDEFYAWITEVCDRKQRARDGAILFLDYNFNERSRLQFQQALISEITLPALDEASKDVARFTITMDAQAVSVAPSNGSKHSGFGTRTQKTLRSSNFRFQLDGLPTDRVSRVELPKLTQRVSTDAAGHRLPIPGPVTISNVQFEVAQSDALPYLQWAQDVLIAGNTAAAERNGSIELLDPSFKEALFTIQFSKLGIVRVCHARTDSKASVIATVKVEMYCEEMTFFRTSSSARSLSVPVERWNCPGPNAAWLRRHQRHAHSRKSSGSTSWQPSRRRADCRPSIAAMLRWCLQAAPRAQTESDVGRTPPGLAEREVIRWEPATTVMSCRILRAVGAGFSVRQHDRAALEARPPWRRKILHGANAGRVILGDLSVRTAEDPPLCASGRAIAEDCSYAARIASCRDDDGASQCGLPPPCPAHVRMPTGFRASGDSCASCHPSTRQ